MRLFKRSRTYKNLLHPRTPGSVEQILELKDIRSTQYFKPLNGKTVPVLSAVNLSIRSGEIWALASRLYLTSSLLLSVIGNTVSYDSGEAKITGENMPRHKRRMLRDVFYIGTTDMLYEDMNVLEFLSFATQHADRLSHLNGPQSQKAILDFLVEADLGYISLSQISYLSEEERVLILMICAYYSNNSFIVLNSGDLKLEAGLVDSFAYIVNAYKESQQAFIFPALNNDRMMDCATHIAVLSHGVTVYQGTVEQLKMEYDELSFTLQARHPKFAASVLVNLLPDYTVQLLGDKILLSHKHSKAAPDDMEIQYLYAQIREAELWIEQVQVNKKTVSNAVKEALHVHDLSL